MTKINKYKGPRGDPLTHVCKFCGKPFVRLGSAKGGAAIYGCPDHNRTKDIKGFKEC